MKKRILLSMVSFFVMATSWASLLEAYQIYVTGANAKTNSTAELTLNMKNRNAINMWECTLVLPEGVTFQSASLITARIPDGFNYEEVQSLSTEARQKLSRIRPKSIGEAQRIPGVSPNDISVLLVLMGR